MIGARARVGVGLLVLLAACDSGRAGDPSRSFGRNPTGGSGDASASDARTGGADGSRADGAGLADAGQGDAGGSDGAVRADASQPGQDVGVGPPDAFTPLPADAGSGGSDAGVFPLPPSCKHACTQPSDCAQATRLYDAAHWSCVGGACEWLGCASAAECVEALGSGYTCAAFPGWTFRTCLHTCGQPSDCVTPNATALFDADNYRCSSGVCEWIGCRDTGECASLGASYVCATVPGAPAAFRSCIESCASPSDCGQASAAFDADNYSCDSNLCVYRGCNSTAECTQTFMSNDYVCD